MHLLTRRTSWATWEIGLIKLTVATFGISVGALWPGTWSPAVPYLLGIGVLCAFWSGAIFLRQLRRAS